MKNTIIVNKNTNQLYYEGVDRQDCINQSKPNFMNHIEKGLDMSDFQYKIIEVTDEELDKYTWYSD